MERHALTPYSELVDGMVLPAPLAGHPALEFCNTFAGWDGGDAGEYLQTFDHLAVWAAASGLVSDGETDRLRHRARRQPREARAALDGARALRRALYAVLTRPERGPEWDRVAADARAALGWLRLRPTPGGAAWKMSPRAGLALPRLALARSAASLLTSPDAHAVRACPGRGCGWLFLDRSGRRRWCTMATCGNRAKARRFSERRGAAGVAKAHDL